MRNINMTKSLGEPITTRFRVALLVCAAALSLALTGCDDGGESGSGATDTGVADTSGGSDTSGITTEADTTPTEADTTTTEADTATTEDATAADSMDDTADTGWPQIEQPAEPPWAVDARGPYNVGYTRRFITYTPLGKTEPREIRIAMWYPTRDADGNNSKYAGLFLREEAFNNASVANDPWLEKMPLLVFSHGNAALAEQSYFMTEFFASHGWIVASPDHTGNTFADTGGAINVSSAPIRPQDISRVIDEMFNLPEDHPLRGRADADHIGMAGHSFGAITTMMTAGASFDLNELIARCESGDLSGRYCELLEDTSQYAAYEAGFYDDRIKVFIPMTPGGATVFQEGFADINSPVLMFTGEMDASLENIDEGDPIWGWMDGPNQVRANLYTAGHFTFSNMCDILGFIEMVFEDGCDTTRFIEPSLAYHIINHYSMAFLRLHLFAESEYAPLFDGTTQPYSDDVELEFKP